ncbi:hypothetical protein [Sphingobium sp. 15-1]|uniref:hypothetical protein n=1 Tax=Sphingobium sp. 15-1 TaxID=2729616 RepID=UPI00159CA3FE|nr:hypothetical protein [Sphingobium sp. 15-1]
MQEPSPRKSRLAIAGGLVAAIALAGTGFLAGRSSVPPPQALPLVADLPPKPVQTPSPSMSVTLERAQLLALATQAADAFASKAPVPEAVEAAGGQRFDLVLPFGCEAPGTVESPGAMRWRFDEKTATLRITIEPVLWRGDTWGDAPVSGEQATFRGFWIARPWSSATSCKAFREPNAETGSDPVLLSGQTVAIARLTDEAAGGKLRPYEVVQRATADDFDPARGFRLRIVGRLAPAAGTGPFHCVQPGGDAQRPLCLINANFSEVRIENPKSDRVLGRWPIGDDIRGSDDRAQ